MPAFAARLQSAAVTPVPPIDSGTSIVSPAASARPSVTVNSAVPPSAMSPVPTRARDTTVGSPSVIDTATSDMAPASVPAGTVCSSTVTVSAGSSALSSAAVRVAVPVAELLGMEIDVADSV